MSEKINFSFRFQPTKTSSDGTLVEFLNSKDLSTTKKEKVLQALKAYWTPFALKHTGDATPEELREAARYAVYMLELHIGLIKENFGLELEKVAPANENAGSSSGNSQVIADKPAEPVALPSEIEEEEEPIDSEEDHEWSDEDGALSRW